VKLIGMLDSPFVRRVAISLLRLELRFEHDPLSVFRTFAAFQRINPVVKAPTLVCDDGTVLMDSTLMLQYAEALARRTLWPTDLAALQRELRLSGLALAACEKSGQIVYERSLRPAEKVHAPWIERVSSQLRGAYAELERELARQPLAAPASHIGAAGIAVAVAWHFTQRVLPGVVAPQQHPRLAQYSDTAEALPAFIAAPYGEGPIGDVRNQGSAP
jgi:glutathione S-transferase